MKRDSVERRGNELRDEKECAKRVEGYRIVTLPVQTDYDPWCKETFWFILVQFPHSPESPLIAGWAEIPPLFLPLAPLPRPERQDRVPLLHVLLSPRTLY